MSKLLVVLVAGLFFFVSTGSAFAEETEVIKLPAPQMDGGMPLMKALKLRQSTRDNYGPDTPLPLQTISNLLWAANGVNREDGKRTAPSAVDWKNIDIYITTANGLFLYDAPKHELKMLGREDIRAVAGQQPFVKTVPLNLIYVADFGKAKFPGSDAIAPTAETWSFAGVGAIAQNVYLYCASEGLACLVRAMADGNAIAKALNLRPDQKFILAQTVAHFKEGATSK